MRAFIKRCGVVMSTLVLLLGVSASLVSAQTKTESGNGFRISPVRSELTIEKGKSQEITVTIENPTDLPTTAKPIVNNFINSDTEDGAARLILDETVATTPKNNFKTLVQNIPDVELGPREKKDIQVSIAIPSDANVGGYYGAIRFSPSITNNAGNVGLTASVGTIVLVRVPGNLTERLDLVQMSASQNGKAKSFLSKGDVSMLIRLKNTGDIHVKPFGKVQIKNMFGTVIKEYELNNVEPRANILPDSTRRFDDAVNYKKWFGRYTATANIGYSQGGGDLISAKTTFWYMPLWSLVMLGVIVLAAVGGVYYVVRKINHKPRHSSKTKH